MSRSSFGHIQTLKNGRCRVFWQDGEKKRSKRLNSKKEAQQFLARMQLSKGQLDFTINYNKFYHGVIKPTYKNLAKRTIAEYEYCWRDIKPYVGKIQVADTTWRLVQDTINKFDAPSRQRKILRFWRKILAYAVRDELLSSNPCSEGITLKKNKKKKKTLYTKDELIQVLNDIKGTEFAMPVLLECCTGLRHEEFCGLNRRDFNYKDGDFTFIEIQRAVTDVHGSKVLKETKTDESTRVVAIHSSFEAYMNDHKHFITNKRTTAEYICPTVYTRHWREYCKEKGIKHVTFGNMRSVYATLASEAGCLDSLISKSMGHTGGNTTQRNYQTASMMALKINAEMLAKYLKFKYKT